MIEKHNAAHKSYIEDLRKSTKRLLNLRSGHYQLPGATQDVLTQAKAALASSVLEIESLKKQLVEKVSENINAPSTSELLQLTRELCSASDETVALKEVLNAQRERVCIGSTGCGGLYIDGKQMC